MLIDGSRELGAVTDPSAATWRIMATPAPKAAVRPPVSLRRIVIQATAMVAVVIAVVGAAAVIVNQRLAKQEAVHEVARTTDLLAESIVQPALTNAMATSPRAASAVLTSRLANDTSTAQVVRVKLWTPAGLVLYSDEARLVGQTFGLDDEAQRALTVPQTEAGITDSSRPENAFESGFGKLLEVYRPVWTPDGHPLLFEAYYRYSLVTDRSRDLWRGFSGIVISSLAAVALLLTPLLWSFYRRARSVQAQREALMQRAFDASTQERRRIAGTLHDGVVQQLAAAAFTIAGESRRAVAQGDHELGTRLAAASDSVRDSVAGMRSLLVDIYPPSLRVGGLAPALADLAKTVNGSQASPQLEIDPDAAALLDAAGQRAVYRVAQECLRNAVKHSGAQNIGLRLSQVDGRVRLDVFDDGVGIEAESGSLSPEGHFGMRLIADVTIAVGGTLSVCSSKGNGALFRMEIPRP